MARFNFRLESILNLKAKVEDLRKNEFGRAMAILEQERHKKAQLEAAKEQTIQTLREQIIKGIGYLAINSYNQYIETTKRRIFAQERVILKAEADVETARVALVEAMRDRKTLDILKDKDYEEFLIEEKKEEQKVVDEIVTYRTGKGS